MESIFVTKIASRGLHFLWKILLEKRENWTILNL